MAEQQPRSGSSHPVAMVAAIATGLLLATTAALLVTAEPTQSTRPGHWLIILVVVLGFGLAERFAFHVEYRREAISFSVSEVPTALALAFMSPAVGISARVVVSLAVIWFATRPPAYKLYFNAALFSFETALAYGIVRLLVDPAGNVGAQFLVVSAVALTAATLVGSFIVSVAISQFEGGLAPRLQQEFRTSGLTTPVVTMLATITVAPALFRPELVLFALVPITAFWLTLQQLGKLSQHHRDLEALHGFAGVVGRPAGLTEVTSLAVEEASRLLRARRGFLQIYDRDGTLVHTSEHGETIDARPASGRDSDWADVLNADGAVVCEIHPDHTVGAATSGRRTMIGVPIRDDTSLIGLLVVAERFGAVDVFEQAELSRANTLAEQLASTLRRTLLHSRMEHAALHDALTGEPNRLAFENAVRTALAQRQNGCTAVMMLDLDRFKEVNDTLGHHVGDRVLIGFTERVKELVGDHDVLARFGGDEFALLVQRADLLAVRELADEILRASYLPMRLDELDVVVTASVGIAEIDAANTDHGDRPDTAEVLRRADVAMYTAKREHTRIETYRQEIDRRTPDRLALLGGLREVLENEGLEVHYQPKVDLVTSTVIGVEALVRWNHPGRGWVSPIEFVQVAEESGLIKQLTDQVLRTAIRNASGWAEAGYELSVAVNLSTHGLLDERLPQRIDEMLRQYGLPAEKLTLEITESALLADTPRTMGTIDRLDQVGVRLSLDDFGTGYSSLGYLRRLPVAELKVDQSFVKNLLLDEQDEAIVRSTIDLAHNLGLQVVAEGIENSPVLERLQAMGCDIGQGYGISRPLAPNLFATWLATTEYRLPRRDARAHT